MYNSDLLDVASSNDLQFYDVQVLFFEQVRTAATGGFLLSDMPSNVRALLGPDSSDDLSVSDVHTARVPSMSGASGWHPDFSTMNPGDINNRISSGAERQCHSVTSAGSLKPPKPRGLFFKPKMFFQKLFSKKVSNSASSRESETHSFSKPAFQGKTSTRIWRHSIT